MVKRELIFTIFIVFLVLISGDASAFQFNGTVYGINGNALANATINVTSRTTNGFTVVASNTTTSNESGWFNMSIAENDAWLFQPIITSRNTSIPTANYTSYIGQNLPSFPKFVYDNLGGTKYYLREAGNFNLTAINSTGSRIAFNFQIKDTTLGYPIAENFNFASGGVLEVGVAVPADRNYSIMIFPNQSLPISYEWDNFTSRATYNLTTPANGNNISHYNGTTRTVHKQFNTSLSFPAIQGFFNLSGNIANASGWREIAIIPYILEPGNMIHATYGALPYNLSAFLGAGDWYDTINGTYNISLPASAENAKYVLFAIAVNVTGPNRFAVYGGVANLTLTYGASNVRLNFTLLGMLGNLSNFTLDNAANFTNKKQLTVVKQSFQLINKTNSSLSQAFSHVEITVNYSQWGCNEFTWMEQVPQSGNGNFSIPLLNVTGIKEMNIFIGGGDYAPKRIELTPAQIINKSHMQGGSNLNLSMFNISINTFNAGEIEGTMAATNILMVLYTSNSTCDVPSPASTCLIGGSNQNMSSFNPMSSIIGGGKLSFRMGTGNISVHYVNVDMLASGPPEALFDDSATDRTSGNSFDQAVRFGSGGPTIYDFVLVSIPYSEAAGSGLNDSGDINITIPLLYDDNWNIVWNTTLNGTSSSALGNNLSHYSIRQSEWSYLLGQTNCTTSTNQFNSSRPCYIDKTGNVAWIRLPHFSGSGPSILGTKVASVTTSSTASAAASSSVGGAKETKWVTVQVLTKEQFDVGYTRELSASQQVSFNVGEEKHSFGVKSLTLNSALIVVNSTPQEATLNIGDSKKFELTKDDFYDIQATLHSIKANKANVTIKAIKEKIETPVSNQETSKAGSEAKGENQETEADKQVESKKPQSPIIINVIIAVIILIIILAAFYLFKSLKIGKKNIRDKVHVRLTGKK